MEVVLSPLAQKKLKKIHRVDQLYIVKKLKQLASGAELSGAKKLKGYDLWRVHAGSYRIVYEKQKTEVYVPTLGHRGEVYHLLKRFF